METIGSFSSAESFIKDHFIAACYVNHTEESRELAKGKPAWAHLVRQLGVSVCLDTQMREERKHLHSSSRLGGKRSLLKAEVWHLWELKKMDGIDHTSNPIHLLSVSSKSRLQLDLMVCCSRQWRWWVVQFYSFFKGTFILRWLLLLQSANCFLLASGSILLLSGGWEINRHTLFNTITHTEPLRNKGGCTDIWNIWTDRRVLQTLLRVNVNIGTVRWFTILSSSQLCEGTWCLSKKSLFCSMNTSFLSHTVRRQHHFLLLWTREELTKAAGTIDGLTWALGTSTTEPTWAWFSLVSSQTLTSSCTIQCSGCFMWNVLCSSIKNSAGFQRGENSSEIRCILTGDLLIQTPIKSSKYFIWVACCCITLHEIWLFKTIYRHSNPLSRCYPKVISHDLSTTWSKCTCTCTNYKFFRCRSWRAPRKKNMFISITQQFIYKSTTVAHK